MMRRSVSLEKQKGRIGLMFMLPWLTGLFVFTAMPFF